MAEIRARSHTSGSWSLPRLGWEMNQCCLIFTPQPFLSTFTQNQNIIQFPFRREREREMQRHSGSIFRSAIQSIMLRTQINFSAVYPIFQSNVFFANIAQDSIPRPIARSPSLRLLLFYDTVLFVQHDRFQCWGGGGNGSLEHQFKVIIISKWKQFGKQ